MITKNILQTLVLCFAACAGVAARPLVQTDTVLYTVTIDADAQSFMVKTDLVPGKDSVTLTFAAWTPGYYQLMHYADQVYFSSQKDFSADETKGLKRARTEWRVTTKKPFYYKTKATRNFVATSYIASDYAYVVPGSLFPMIDGNLAAPVKVKFESGNDVKIRTALKRTANSTFVAKNIDELYDSPILIGSAVVDLPVFTVQGKRHHFAGVHLADFDREPFIGNMTKIVDAAARVVGEIPYSDYYFLAIGPGQGGIERTNSTSFAFDGKGLHARESALRTYSFLAHEYFHHYNAKRIRPIELGPFDYTKANRTNMLWVAEGVTVYYDHLILARAGLTTKEELLDSFAKLIATHEANPGKEVQTLANASYETWSDGPFGRENGKTISVYVKGTIVAFMLDLAIREATEGKRCLDDVMRALYKEYYVKQGRGFTEEEFRNVCEQIAGANLQEIFDYVYTLKPIDYNKYLASAGLSMKNESEGYSISIAGKASAKQKKVLSDWIKR